MTVPWLMNCPHSDDSWCLECVRDLAAQLERANEDWQVAVGIADRRALAAEQERDRLREALQSLSQRIRAGSEAAPWVVEAIDAALASPTATGTPDWMRPDREGEKA